MKQNEKGMLKPPIARMGGKSKLRKEIIKLLGILKLKQEIGYRRTQNVLTKPFMYHQESTNYLTITC